ncbi:hypothetical protein NGRA_0401 [Nosema granulosis]|uniref:Uncharacterized protein n=1 Tax=Nosema granulosis TaxID=83296 RepID=A0A9P6L0K6_9MICR|nr:hypothetical protein NGRA_0401 [Nosema granulosis]
MKLISIASVLVFVYILKVRASEKNVTEKQDMSIKNTKEGEKKSEKKETEEESSQQENDEEADKKDKKDKKSSQSKDDKNESKSNGASMQDAMTLFALVGTLLLTIQ